MLTTLRHVVPLLAAAALLASPACQRDKGDKNKDDDSKAEDGKATATDQGAGKRVKIPGQLMGGKHSQNKATMPRPKKPQIPPPEDVAAPPANATKTATGLAYKILDKKDGAKKPGQNDTVTVQYTGWTTDGKTFDTSKGRKAPAKFQLSKVISGWTEGLQHVGLGEKARLWIPEKLAYQGRKGAPAGMLVFDIELLSFDPAPPVPADVAKPPAGAKKTPLGVFYKVLKKGNGKDKPNSWDKVKVHYSGWTTDGKMFDSSVARKRPAQFSVDGVIAGWTDALQQMSKGSKWLIWIPEEHAYKGRPGRPAGMLVFEVELLEITRMPEPPPTPKDVKAPPANAKKTEAGVSYVILKKGKPGGASPTAASKVKVHYSGWTTDGKMFDSSVKRGKPIEFGLGAVIPGWRDGLQQMKVGETARLWIPGNLAYDGKPGKPQGMLVFDVELLDIVGP